MMTTDTDRARTLAARAADAAAWEDRVRTQTENILWIHQLGWDTGPGGWIFHQSICHGCDWRSDVHDLRAYAKAAHVRHVADLVMAVVVDGVPRGDRSSGTA